MLVITLTMISMDFISCNILSSQAPCVVNGLSLLIIMKKYISVLDVFHLSLMRCQMFIKMYTNH